MDDLDQMIAKSTKPESSPAAKLVLEFLTSSMKFTEEAQDEVGNASYAAGKAVAYYRAAEKLAKAVSPKLLESPVFATLMKKLTPISEFHRTMTEPKVELQISRELVVPKPKEEAPEPPRKEGFTDTEKFNRLVSAIQKWGTPNHDAVKMAFSVFDEKKTIEEMLKRVLR